MIDYTKIEFVLSAFKQAQCPSSRYPEIAFAGRSNVGKSSLINRLVNRRNLVKVSARPGKTQSLNYFLVDQALYLVDLPGYGYAKVPMAMKNDWQTLIPAYLTSRKQLCCVVVIVDLRHEAKATDQELISWLKSSDIPILVVYTKADKLTKSLVERQARALDVGLGLFANERLVFSAKTGEGKEELGTILAAFIARGRMAEAFVEGAPSPEPSSLVEVAGEGT